MPLAMPLDIPLGMPLGTGGDRRLRCKLGVDADLRVPGSRARGRGERGLSVGEALPCAFEGLSAVTAEPESCRGGGLRCDCWRSPQDLLLADHVYRNYGQG